MINSPSRMNSQMINTESRGLTIVIKKLWSSTYTKSSWYVYLINSWGTVYRESFFWIWLRTKVVTKKNLTFRSCRAHLLLSYTYFRENFRKTNNFFFARKQIFSQKSAKISRHQSVFLCFTFSASFCFFVLHKRHSNHLLIFITNFCQVFTNFFAISVFSQAIFAKTRSWFSLVFNIFLRQFSFQL